MKISQEDLEIIERYLKGELSSEESKAFEARLESESALREIYVEYIKGRRAIDYAIKNRLKEKVSQALTEKKERKIIWLRPLSIAAGFIILIAGAFWIFSQQSDSPRELYSEYYTLPSTPNMRSQDQSPNTQQALIAYQNKNYESADTLLQQLLEKENVVRKDELILIYAGILTELDRDVEAIAQLSLIRQESALYQDAQWYQLMSYLKLSDIEQSKTIIDDILNTPKHFKLKEAREILSQLD